MYVCTHTIQVARMHVGIDATYSTAATSTLRYVRTRNKFQSRNWKDSGLAEALLFASLRDCGYSTSDIPSITCRELIKRKKQKKIKTKTSYIEFFGCKILLNMDYVHECGKSDLDKISRCMKYVWCAQCFSTFILIILFSLLIYLYVYIYVRIIYICIYITITLKLFNYNS